MPAALPLDGQSVLVMRPKGQELALMENLRSRGANAVHVPLLEILPPASYQPLDCAIRQLGQYQWLLFSSVNGVTSFCARAAALAIPLNAHSLGSLRVCVIGPATREAAEACGLAVDVVPDRFVAEGLAEVFRETKLHEARVLFPRAAVAREVATDALRQQGAIVDVVEAYRSGIPNDSEERIRALVQSGQTLHWILFTSASTVKNLLAVGGEPLLRHARIASIGPATTAAMQKHGLTPTVESQNHTAAGLVMAIVDALDSGSDGHPADDGPLPGAC